MKKFILWSLAAILLLAVGLAAWSLFRLRDRHPGYSVDIDIRPEGEAPLRAGFAARSITPPIPDSWTDIDGDARYEPDQGETFQDGNGNGQFDPVWIAGFHQNRPAQGVHDSLWARAMVIDDGSTRLALVALDAIGFMSDDIIDIRKSLPSALEVDYLIITSTHTHEAPDLLGLWGASEFRSGIDPDYMELIKTKTRVAVEAAVSALRPARLRFGQDLRRAEGLVEDSRRPIVTDPGIRVMQAVDAEADTTLGSLFAWANHPETLWSRNLLLSSDFPHYVREGMERGVLVNDSLIAEGLGGICLYVNGAIGGLMTTSPSFSIPSLAGDTLYYEPSFDKAEAQGQTLALLGLQALSHPSALDPIGQGGIQLRAKTVELPLANPLFRLAAVLGVLDRGTSGWFTVRSEVAAWRIGPATFLHQPGELYPEILNGGIESPEGADFIIEPLETPPIREQMPGRFTFVVGLSNDMVGYIIPQSEWDEEAPFLYNAESSPYGEINSLGPDTGPLLYKAMVEVLRDIQ